MHLAGISFTLLLAAVSTASAMESYQPGYKTIEVESSHYAAPFSSAVFYPAIGDGNLVSVGENPVFKGAEARQDASSMQGQFPVILLLIEQLLSVSSRPTAEVLGNSLVEDSSYINYRSWPNSAPKHEALYYFISRFAQRFSSASSTSIPKYPRCSPVSYALEATGLLEDCESVCRSAWVWFFVANGYHRQYFPARSLKLTLRQFWRTVAW